jgi:hypothetical protein
MAKLRDKMGDILKVANNAERKADNLKTAIVRVQDFASKVQDKTRILSDEITKLSPEFALNALGLPHSDAVAPDIEGMIESSEGEKKEVKESDEEEEEGNFVESYVDQ